MAINRSTLSKAMLALIAAGAPASVLLSQFLDEKEGNSLTSYQDGVRVWTACRGVTKGIGPNMKFTKAQCDKMNASAMGKALTELDGMIHVPLSEPARAGITSFCTYNIGATKCWSSTFLKDLNAGRRVDACNQIPRWIFDGGKDCRIKANKCEGQIIRRAQERELCLMEDSP